MWITSKVSAWHPSKVMQLTVFQAYPKHEPMLTPTITPNMTFLIPSWFFLLPKVIITLFLHIVWVTSSLDPPVYWCHVTLGGVLRQLHVYRGSAGEQEGHTDPRESSGQPSHQLSGTEDLQEGHNDPRESSGQPSHQLSGTENQQESKRDTLTQERVLVSPLTKYQVQRTSRRAGETHWPKRGFWSALSPTIRYREPAGDQEGHTDPREGAGQPSHQLSGTEEQQESWVSAYE